jgi:hypothetical protein
MFSERRTRAVSGDVVPVCTVPLATARAALATLDAEPRDVWLTTGMALHSAFPDDAGFAVWDEWSQTALNYDAEACAVTWSGFRSGGGVTLGTLLHMAREVGWTQKAETPESLPPPKPVPPAKPRPAPGEVAARAKALWDKATPNAAHPYLARKGVAAHGVRVLPGPQPLLLVPMRNAQKQLVSLEFIAADGGKQYMRGTPKQGAFHVIAPKGADTSRILIAEGYATAVSAYEASRHPVFVAFDAGNLKHVAEHVRRAAPNTPIVMLADDDWQTAGNPGVAKARAAAEAVGGLLATPKFTGAREQKDTDFNDMARRHGLAAVKAAIAAAKNPMAEDIPEDFPDLARIAKGKFCLRSIDKAPTLCVRMQLKEEAEDGTEKKQEVIQNLLLPGRMFYATEYYNALDGDTESCGGMVIRYRASKGIWHQDVISARNLSDAKALKAFLGSKNMYLNPALGDKAGFLLMEYAMAQFTAVQQRREVAVARSGFGYQLLSGRKMAWISGAHAFHADGAITRALASPEMSAFRDIFTLDYLPPGGDGENTAVIEAELKTRARKFMEGVHLLFPEGAADAHRFALLAAIASPALQFVESNPASVPVLPGFGVTLSLYSRISGRGKSVAAKLGALAFTPADTHLTITGGIGGGLTSLTTVLRARAVFRNMPQILDEATSTDPQEVSGYVYQIANGTEKARSTRSGQLQYVRGSWAGVSIATTNIPMRDALARHTQASAAEQQRLLELCVDDTDMTRLPPRAEMSRIWEEYIMPNAGAVGTLLARWLMMAPDTHATLVRAESALMASTPGITVSNRFYARLYTAMGVANAGLNALGIPAFSMRSMRTVFRSLIGDAGEFMDSTIETDADIFQRMLNDLAPRIMVTSTGYGQGRSNFQTAPDITPLNMVARDAIAGRYALDNQRLGLIASALHKWCRENMRSPRHLVDYMRNAGALDAPLQKHGRCMRRLTVGIRGMTPLNALCYDINMRHLNATIPMPEPEDTESAQVIPMHPPKPKGASHEHSSTYPQGVAAKAPTTS